jgi:L-asparaginase
MLRQTYGGPSSEIALRKAGLIWGGRLHPLKARVLLETCLRAGLDPAAIIEVFDPWG